MIISAAGILLLMIAGAEIELKPFGRMWLTERAVAIPDKKIRK